MEIEIDNVPSWETLIGDDPSTFVFTAAALKKFISTYCSDPWAAGRSLLAHADCIAQPNYESLRAIPKRRPPSLAFPLLDLPTELISAVVKHVPHGSNREIRSRIANFKTQIDLKELSLTSKLIRGLTFPRLFSSLPWGLPGSVTTKPEFWDNYPGFSSQTPSKITVVVSQSDTMDQSICEDLDRLIQNGFGKKICHVSLALPGGAFWDRLDRTMSSFEDLTSMDIFSPDFNSLPLILERLTSLTVVDGLNQQLCDCLSQLPHLHTLEYIKWNDTFSSPSSNCKFNIKRLRLDATYRSTGLGFNFINFFLCATSTTLQYLTIQDSCVIPPDEELPIPEMEELHHLSIHNVRVPSSALPRFHVLFGQSAKKLRTMKLSCSDSDVEARLDVMSLVEKIPSMRSKGEGWNSLDAIYFNRFILEGPLFLPTLLLLRESNVTIIEI